MNETPKHSPPPPVELLGNASGAAEPQDPITLFVEQQFSDSRALVLQPSETQTEDGLDTLSQAESDDVHPVARAFEAALADLKANIVDQVRHRITAYIREELLPTMEGAINHGADSLKDSKRSGPVDSAEQRAKPTERQRQPLSGSSSPPWSQGPGRPVYWASPESEPYLEPPQVLGDGVYEGVLRLLVKAGTADLLQVVHLVGELRQRPDLRLLKLVTIEKGTTEIVLALREPLHMEGFLLQIDGVQQVETDTSLSPEDDEPLIHVQLGNSGTKARGAAAD